ncbi:hypothetical protein [Anaerolentibacter hominis]|uniref:Kelch repeat-containing protein n=1 Tax=Anaerolentibacter hominis TaxID=3079009 RepID=UPI0031B83B6F
MILDDQGTVAGLVKNAELVDYNNTDSGLTSNNVQGAIDELKADSGTANDNLLGQINGLKTDSHVHENKETLDSILQTDVEKIRNLETQLSALKQELETSIDTGIASTNEGFQAEIKKSVNRDTANPTKFFAEGMTGTLNVKSLRSLPYEFYDGSAVVWNDEIHILGGNGGSTKHYKLNRTSWYSTSTLPYGFYYGSAVVWNNEIHILGGSGGHTKHYKFDGTSWTSVSTLPYEFYQGSAVVWNDEIHILGSNASGCYTKHYKFDGTLWTSVSTLPYSFCRGSAVVWNDMIYILGGDGGNTNNYRFNGSWTLVSGLSKNLCYGSAVVYNNYIHIMGSYVNSAYLKYHIMLSGATTITTTSFLKDLNYNFGRGNAVVWENKIYILGGGDSRTKISNFEKTGIGWISSDNEAFLYYLPKNTEVVYDNTITEVLGDEISRTQEGILTNSNQTVYVVGAGTVCFRN